MRGNCVDINSLCEGAIPRAVEHTRLFVSVRWLRVLESWGVGVWEIIVNGTMI